MSINDKYSSAADIISRNMGQFPIFAIGSGLLVIWFFSGFWFGFSDAWQLLVNTPTTIIEFFIGLFLAAAANRTEKHTKEILDTLVEYQKQELKELEIDTKILLKENEVLKKENEILKNQRQGFALPK